MRALTLFLLLAVALPAEARRAMTFDDFIGLKRVKDLQLSPDGRQAAFVVTTFDKKANTKNADVWLVSVAGGAPRRLTTHAKSDFAPRWAPESRRLAFLSTRGGAPQVFIMRLDGGEPRQVTTRPLGVAGPPVWSRDGSRILVPGPAYPACRDEKCNAAKAKAQEESKVKARLYDDIPVRAWDSWRDETRSHLFLVDVRSGKARDLTPGTKDVPPLDLTGPSDYAFTRDGGHVVFTRVDEPPAQSTNADLYVVPVGGGTPRRLTANRANDSYPRFSPDGRTLAYRAMVSPGYESERRRLTLMDWRTKKLTNLTEQLDRSVDNVVWAADGTTIYFDADDEGYRSIYAVAPRPGARPRKVVSRRYTHGFGVAPDGTLVYVAESANQPPEIYRWRGGKETALTRLNQKALAPLDLRPAEHLWYAGAKGARIHSIVVKPPGFRRGKRYPLLVIVHGGPQGMMGDMWHWRWSYQMFAAAGYVVFTPNFHGSSGFGGAHQDAIRGDWGGAPYQDVMKGVQFMERQAYVDRRRVCAAGASYGGYLVNWIAGNTSRFRCLISHDGLYNLFSMNAATDELWFPEWEFRGTPYGSRDLHQKWSPHRLVHRIKTPMLVIHGEQDMRVPVEEALQLFNMLRRRKVPAKLLVFPDEGHFVLKPQNADLWWRTMHGWLRRYLR